MLEGAAGGFPLSAAAEAGHGDPDPVAGGLSHRDRSKSGPPTSSRTWWHRPDQWPTSAAGLAHALALARCGYDVVGVDGALRMVEVARTRAARDKVEVTFDVRDVSAPLLFADASLGGVLAILVVQHLPHPAAFIAEIRRCLRPGGHLLITAPARDSTSLTSQNLYWRLRAACYHLVPGVVRFYDTNSLPRLVEDQGLTVIQRNGGPGRVIVLARA